MKIIIEIPERVYEHAKETSEDSIDETTAMRAIANGTQQMTGRWIPTSDISKWGYKCSVCEGIDSTDLGHFCKWCGVKMGESQESEDE